MSRQTKSGTELDGAPGPQLAVCMAAAWINARDVPVVLRIDQNWKTPCLRLSVWRSAPTTCVVYAKKNTRCLDQTNKKSWQFFSPIRTKKQNPSEHGEWVQISGQAVKANLFFLLVGHSGQSWCFLKCFDW
jgi:hypothetical protein